MSKKDAILSFIALLIWLYSETIVDLFVGAL